MFDIFPSDHARLPALEPACSTDLTNEKVGREDCPYLGLHQPAGSSSSSSAGQLLVLIVVIVAAAGRPALRHRCCRPVRSNSRPCLIAGQSTPHRRPCWPA